MRAGHDQRTPAPAVPFRNTRKLLFASPHRAVEHVKTAAEARAAMMGLEKYVHQAGLDRGLLELVKLRASLINGAKPSSAYTQ